MSAPRPVYPGETYLITRRVTQRDYLLRPSSLVNSVVLYCLAVAASKYDVLVHAVTVMSNHYHIVLTDPRGRLPDFERWLNSMIARALNASYGRWENFWAPEQPSNVRLLGPQDVLDKIVYTATNPVAAGLVSHGNKWPGLRLFSPGVRRVDRPSGFFGEDSELPAVAELDIVPPPLGLSAHHAFRTVADAVNAKEEAIRATFREAGRSFAGAQRVLAQKPTDSPTTIEPRRQLSPQVAGRNKWQRIEALQRCKQFIAEYRAALRAWVARVANVVFPHGTFLIARRFDVPVAAPS